MIMSSYLLKSIKAIDNQVIWSRQCSQSLPYTLKRDLIILSIIDVVEYDRISLFNDKEGSEGPCQDIQDLYRVLKKYWWFYGRV